MGLDRIQETSRRDHAIEENRGGRTTHRASEMIDRIDVVERARNVGYRQEVTDHHFHAIGMV
jgi:hypothetical protein